MISGILSLVANVVLLPSVIGITYGRRALRRGTALRGEVTAGVVLGAVGLALSLGALLLLVLPFLLVDRGAVLEHQVEAHHRRGRAAGHDAPGVACPKPDSPQAGTAISCTAQATSVGPVRIDVAFTGPTSCTARLVRAG